jgi:DNA invertase Pin-like site-specific DNA recombinase
VACRLLAEFIRELIVEGIREGLDAARARAARGWGGRRADPPRPRLLARPDNTISSIAQLFGVSRAAIYKYVPEVTTGRKPPPSHPVQR